jgi:long-chain acyl-CoA synthetase
MDVRWLLSADKEVDYGPSLIWRDESVDKALLTHKHDEWCEILAAYGVAKGDVVSIEGDFTPASISLLLALITNDTIIVPLTRAGDVRRAEHLTLAHAQWLIQIDSLEMPTISRVGGVGRHALLESLKEAGAPGLVLFTSGSSGRPKAAVHNFERLLRKFRTRRPALRTLNFLLFDHWGGLNTLFHALAAGATVVAVEDRTPDAVCRLIERHKVQLLPTSPTFLNLLLLSGAHVRHDLSSLKVVSYGSEPMPKTTLERVADALPDVKLLQTYGLIELGVLRSRSRDNRSLWVKVGGEGYDVRVRDGLLEVKAESAMLGYLNAESPFTADGWFKTGDAVEQDGEWLRILGRKSELINVGGEKVFPTEVENVIQEMENVAEVTVFAEPNLVLGQIVAARVRLVEPEDVEGFRERLKRHCRGRLKKFMIPMRVTLGGEALFGERFKKLRTPSNPGGDEVEESKDG